MRKALLALAAVLMLVAAVPSQAQEVIAAVGFGQEACALFEEEVDAGSVLFGSVFTASGGVLLADVCGISFSEVWTDTGPAEGQFGCAAVVFLPADDTEEFFADFGCGDLTVDVDPLLQTASISGTFPSDFYSPSMSEASSITIDVDWTATPGGAPIAGAGGFADVITLPFIDAGGGAFVVVPADADGSISSEILGAPEGPAVDAIIDEGVGLFVAVFV